jgi:hypothetical protein
MGWRPARLRLIAGIAVAVLAGLGSAIAGAAVLARALGLHHTANPSPDSPANECYLAEAILTITVVCACLAIHLAGRLRHPAARTDDSPGDPYAIPRLPRRKRRTSEAVVIWLGTVLFTAGFFFATATAVADYSYVGRSAYVQAHGIREAAEVDHVQNIEENGKGGPNYTATLTVTVTSPGHGARTAVVYDPHQTTIKPGATITVLADPGQPAYAELPGQPYNNYVLLIVLAGLGALTGAIAAYLWLELIAMIQRRPVWSLVPSRVARAYLMSRKSGLKPTGRRRA